jgi:hypothetical protein
MDALDYACDIKEVPQLRRPVTAGEQRGSRNPQFTIELPPFVTNIPHEERPKVQPSGQDRDSIGNMKSQDQIVCFIPKQTLL